MGTFSKPWGLTPPSCQPANPSSRKTSLHLFPFLCLSSWGLSPKFLLFPFPLTPLLRLVPLSKYRPFFFYLFTSQLTSYSSTISPDQRGKPSRTIHSSYCGKHNTSTLSAFIILFYSCRNSEVDDVIIPIFRMRN